MMDNEKKSQDINDVSSDEYLVTNKKNNLFNIIIGIATLLIAILGATFAYFSASASSDENDVNLKSAYLSVSYSGGTKIAASELIPSSLYVVLTEYQKDLYGDTSTDRDYEYERRCVDDKGKQVCYVYQFSVSSSGESGGTTDISGSIKINTNQFDNLSYLLYEVTFATDENGDTLIDEYTLDEEGNPIERVSNYELVDTNFTLVDRNDDYEGIANIFNNGSDIYFNSFLKPVDNTDDDGNLVSTTYPVACLFGYTDDYVSNSGNYTIDDTSKCSSLSISNNVQHTYQLVIWLEETGEVQNNEQGLSFAGTVTIDVEGSSDVSGYEDGRVTGTITGD